MRLRSSLNHAAVANEDNLVADAAGLPQIMGNHDDRV